MNITDIKPGTFFRIEIEDIFGDTRSLFGKFVKRTQYGYNTPCGSWALYNTDGKNILSGYNPAYFITYIPKGRRKPITINENKISRIEEMPQ